MSEVEIGGVVLCGGHSKRMGRPKAWLPFGPETMLQRVVRLLSVAAQPVVVVAAAGQRLPALPADVQVVIDERPDLGPLQGICSGLAALAGLRQAAYVTGCDVPLLEPRVVSRLAALLDGHEIVVAEQDEYLHPLAAVYRTTLTERARALLDEDRRRPLFLIRGSDSLRIPVDAVRDLDPELRTFRNLNDPDAYRAALHDAGLPAE